jgi:hypothetical protein
MGDIINLRQARKRRTRDEAQARATAARTTFGLSKGERAKTALEREVNVRRLDGHRVEAPLADPTVDGAV